jgi:tRNA:m4X modification enzyme
MERKRRYCRGTRYPDSVYCCNHRGEFSETDPCPTISTKGGLPSASNAASDKKKIPCPLDPSHSVYAHKLERHLKVCPKAKELRELESQPYFLRGANAGTSTEAEDGAEIVFDRSSALELAWAVKRT